MDNDILNAFAPMDLDAVFNHAQASEDVEVNIMDLSVVVEFYFWWLTDSLNQSCTKFVGLNYNGKIMICV